jgi:hypothetical protein
MNILKYLLLYIALSHTLYASHTSISTESDATISPAISVPLRQPSIEVDYLFSHGYRLCLHMHGRRSLGIYLLQQAGLHNAATIDQRLEIANLLRYLKAFKSASDILKLASEDANL